MSVFRPAARVTSPDGRDWEIYAYRIALPERRPYDPGFGDIELVRFALPNPLDGLLWLVGNALLLAVRVLWDVPRAAVRALGSDEWTIEAVTWAAHRTSFTWRTTAEYRGHVLARVEGELAEGRIPPHPRHATYLGARG